MFLKHGILALAFSLVAVAQTPAQKAYEGQSWVGLLVSADCLTGKTGTADRSRATTESDLTVNGRVTTPQVDESGTRGQSTELMDGAKPVTEKQRLPHTGDVLARNTSSIDPGWAAARRQARSLNDVCGLQADTRRFALILADGSKLEFDEVANQAIAPQVPAVPSNGRRILRVSVQGKLQNGRIALTSIQM
jgi:hypothetical protein